MRTNSTNSLDFFVLFPTRGVFASVSSLRATRCSLCARSFALCARCTRVLFQKPSSTATHDARRLRACAETSVCSRGTTRCPSDSVPPSATSAAVPNPSPRAAGLGGSPALRCPVPACPPSPRCPPAAAAQVPFSRGAGARRGEARVRESALPAGLLRRGGRRGSRGRVLGRETATEKGSPGQRSCSTVIQHGHTAQGEGWRDRESPVWR